MRMFGGMKNSGAKLAVLAAFGVLAGGVSAQAADLGGNCCADLEERIAELEATTARKGNRKVSLEVSGHVNEALIFWDDGFEQNQGVYTNDNSRTRFRFKGSATIADGVKAGYLLEIGVRGANSKRFTQNDSNPAAEAGLDIRHSAWYVESKSLGTVWVGRTGPAAEGITEINLAQTKDVAKFTDVEDSALGLNIRSSTGGQSNLSWRRLINDSGDQPGETERGQIVKYVSPEFGGFAVTSAWGGDDYWDVGLNFKGELGDFKIAAGIAYGQETSIDADAGIIDTCLSNGAAAGTGSDFDCEQVGGSISVMHAPTGLYLNFAGGLRTDNNIAQPGVFDGLAANADDESTFYAIEGGIEQKFTSLGKTTLFGQYYNLDGGSDDLRDSNAVLGVGNIAGTELQMYGGGIVQGIDAAAMLLYVYYRHYEGDLDLVNNAGVPVISNNFEDLDMVVAGGIIKF
jgi:hypothetical protein